MLSREFSSRYYPSFAFGDVSVGLLFPSRKIEAK
jgi:hypothetical protein